MNRRVLAIGLLISSALAGCAMKPVEMQSYQPAVQQTMVAKPAVAPPRHVAKPVVARQRPVARTSGSGGGSGDSGGGGGDSGGGGGGWGG